MIPMLRQILRTGIVSEPPPEALAAEQREAARLGEEILRILGRALVIRQIDAGSCNGCELEIHALNSPYYNLEALGIKFAASPRHADLLLVTGPVSRQHGRGRAPRPTTPHRQPKLVVAVGDCGCTGGIFGESYACCGRGGQRHSGRCRACPAARRRPSRCCRASWLPSAAESRQRLLFQHQQAHRLGC